MAFRSIRKGKMVVAEPRRAESSDGTNKRDRWREEAAQASEAPASPECPRDVVLAPVPRPLLLLHMRKTPSLS